MRVGFEAAVAAVALGVRRMAVGCLGAVMTAVAANAADPGYSAPLSRTSVDVVEALESRLGVPVVLLERTGADVERFWLSAMRELCDTTGDNWCEGEVMFLDDTTNALGWSRLIDYEGDDGAGKRVCLVLPPEPGLSPGYGATGISGGGTYMSGELPTSDHVVAWLLMQHVGNCAPTLAPQAPARADAFASLMLTLMEGHSGFVSGRDVTPVRKIARWRRAGPNGWAVSLGERILLEHWKPMAAAHLTQRGCRVTPVPSTDIATHALRRDGALRPSDSCRDASGDTIRDRVGRVTDANLWLWADGRGTDGFSVPMPPAPYAPFQSFPSVEAAVAYGWDAAIDLSRR